MVRAKSLTPTALIDAFRRGDFYASTGVTLKEVTMTDGTLSVEIEPEDGISYTTQFIGTLAGATDLGGALLLTDDVLSVSAKPLP